MNQLLVIFGILFIILIGYVFLKRNKKTSNDSNNNNSNENNIENYQNNDDNISVEEEETNMSDEEININNEVSDELDDNDNNLGNNIQKAPMSVNEPVHNGYESNLVYNSPFNIGECSIPNALPKKYYETINKKLEQEKYEKVMNGGSFGQVVGFENEDSTFEMF